jgi:membrane-associated phospholipid phosphatase
MLRKLCLALLLLLVVILADAQAFKVPKISVENTYKNKIKIGSVIAIGLIGTGVYMELSENKDHWYSNKYAFQEMVFDKIPNYETVIDDYTQFAALGVATSMIVLDPLKKSKFGEQFAHLFVAEFIGVSTMGILKKVTKRPRPDGSKMNSFPSGHTTQAFIAARFLDREFKDDYPWLVYTGYVLASFTGASRILNNRHWISDVLVGAGLGILSVDLTYLLFDKFKTKKVILTPTVYNKGAGFYFSLKF